MLPLFAPDWIYRIPLYIIYGLVCEFLFTSLSDLIYPQFVKSWNVFGSQIRSNPPTWRVQERDPRGQGYSFLWMIPIYALLIYMEPASVLMKNIPLAIRGIIYVILLWAVEYITGFLIKKISGRCPWDYSASKYNLHGYIRWDFFPFWYLFVVMAEWLSVKFIALTPAIKIVFGLV